MLATLLSSAELRSAGDARSRVQATHAAWMELAEQCTLQHQAEQLPGYEPPNNPQVSLQLLTCTAALVRHVFRISQQQGRCC